MIAHHTQDHSIPRIATTLGWYLSRLATCTPPSPLPFSSLFGTPRSVTTACISQPPFPAYLHSLQTPAICGHIQSVPTSVSVPLHEAGPWALFKRPPESVPFPSMLVYRPSNPLHPSETAWGVWNLKPRVVTRWKTNLHSVDSQHIRLMWQTKKTNIRSTKVRSDIHTKKNTNVIT